MSTFHPPPSTLPPPHQPPPPPHSVAGVAGGAGVAVFVLERFSKHSPAVAKGVAVDSRTSLHQGQLHSGASGATVQTPPAVGGRWSDHPGSAYPQTPLPQSGLGLGFGGGGGGSGTRSRPSGFGQTVAETKEQSTWIHLSAPQHSVTLKIHRPSSSSSSTSNSTTQGLQPFLILDDNDDAREK